nr:MAG TPA: hypothetical protein [Caudoviricetes sp.]
MQTPILHVQKFSSGRGLGGVPFLLLTRPYLKSH